jgi:ParG
MTKPTPSAPKIKRLNINLDAELHAAFKSAVAARKTDMGKVLAESASTCLPPCPTRASAVNRCFRSAADPWL